MVPRPATVRQRAPRGLRPGPGTHRGVDLRNRAHSRSNPLPAYDLPGLSLALGIAVRSVGVSTPWGTVLLSGAVSKLYLETCALGLRGVFGGLAAAGDAGVAGWRVSLGPRQVAEVHVDVRDLAPAAALVE